MGRGEGEGGEARVGSGFTGPWGSSLLHSPFSHSLSLSLLCISTPSFPLLFFFKKNHSFLFTCFPSFFWCALGKTGEVKVCDFFIYINTSSITTIVYEKRRNLKKNNHSLFEHSFQSKFFFSLQHHPVCYCIKIGFRIWYLKERKQPHPPAKKKKIMHSSLAPILSLLATLTIPTLAQNGPYFVLGSGMPVSIQRLDPLLSAGKVSGHVHSIVGGNAFAAAMDFASTQTASCSTIRVIADKSNYWMPALYFHNPAINGSYIRVPEKPDHRIYYKFGKGDNTPDLERSEFPEGFRMISGSANLRHDDGSMGVGGNQLNWVCHDGGSNPKATGFPKGFSNCDSYGFAASMRFPSCWSGRDFDPAHPLAHMDFPTNQDGLAGCREGFKVKRFPEIFVEYYLNTKSFNGLYGPNDLPWVLAQGDPTGYGFHMDFVSSSPPPFPFFPPHPLVSPFFLTHTWGGNNN